MSFSLLIDSVVDSTYSIPFVPANVLRDNFSRLDKIEIKTKEVADLLRKGIALRTAAMSPKAFLEKFREIREPILVLTTSSKLSGIYRSAMVAVRMCKKKIFVIDTLSASIGAGLIADVAFEMMKAGENIETVMNKVNELVNKVTVYLLPESMKYLARSGRIPDLIAKIGDVAGILPVLKLKEGKFSIARIVRNFASGVEFMLEKVRGRAIVGSIDNEIWEEKMLSQLKDARKAEQISAALAVHVGPGAVGVAFID